MYGSHLHWLDALGGVRHRIAKIIATIDQPFQKSGGIKTLKGNIGEGFMKVSAVTAERHIIEAPAMVFHNQDDVKTAFQSGDLNKDVIVVVCYQGP